VRTCMGCGQRDLQAAMVRIASVADKSLVPDPGRCFGGRGGYLHPTEDCWAPFANRKGLVRSLNLSVDRRARKTLIDDLRVRLGY